MAHKTLIGGTIYEISGGKTLVGGTAYSIKNGKTLVGGTAYEVGFKREGVSSTGEILDDWTTISSAKNIGLYSVGNYKPITLTDTGETVIMEIVALNADTKSNGGTAHITWISRTLIDNAYMNNTNTNENGWYACALRAYLQSDIYNILPSELRNVIVSVNKTYYDRTSKSTKTCVDNVWIPSYREIFGNSDGNSKYETSGVDYTSFFTSATKIKKTFSDGSVYTWWLRTAVSTLTTAFYNVKTSGSGTSSSSTNYPSGVALGFCT